MRVHRLLPPSRIPPHLLPHSCTAPQHTQHFPTAAPCHHRVPHSRAALIPFAPLAV